MADARLILGDCLEVLPTLPSASVDCVITDPPYPCIKRSYGTWTEVEWFSMMRVVVPECMRILKPTGSAVFILQPNSERVGRMRIWLWEFMVWVGKEWGIVQDAYWWNTGALTVSGCAESIGLMRPALKSCVWIGNSNCYRSQRLVLWREADSTRAQRLSQRYIGAIVQRSSGKRDNVGKMRGQAGDRGGTVPHNVFPIASGGIYNGYPESSVGDGLSNHLSADRLRCGILVGVLIPPPVPARTPFAGEHVQSPHVGGNLLDKAVELVRLLAMFPPCRHDKIAPSESSRDAEVSLDAEQDMLCCSPKIEPHSVLRRHPVFGGLHPRQGCLVGKAPHVHQPKSERQFRVGRPQEQRRVFGRPLADWCRLGDVLDTLTSFAVYLFPSVPDSQVVSLGGAVWTPRVRAIGPRRVHDDAGVGEGRFRVAHFYTSFRFWFHLSKRMFPHSIPDSLYNQHKHPGGTPAALCDYWLRYICPSDGTVLDPFSGSGTVALAALKQGKRAISIERIPEYHAIAEKRIREAQNALPLFAEIRED